MANIIITGANQGIGYYLAKHLLENKNKVAVFDLQTDHIESLTTTFEKNLLCFEVDVRNQEQLHCAVEKVIHTFHSIDIAIHNACQCTFEAEINTELDTYRDVFEVNYFGALRLAKSVLPYMIQQGKGRVIFTSSGVGVTGFSKISPYASSKGAIESLAKCLKVEYAKKNISFHIFHPPLTQTKSSEPLPVSKEFMASPEKVGQGLAKHIYAKSFVICHNVWQKIQILGCYLFPTTMGSLLSKMTENSESKRSS